MKKIFLSVIILVAALVCHAQVSDADAAKALQLVSASKADIGLSANDISQVKVTTSYYDRSTGLDMVYLQQTYAGIPILKQILPLAFKNGKLASKAGAFEHNIEQLVDVKTNVPAVSASSAVQFAIADRKLTASKMPVVVSTKENGRKIEFNDMGVSHENITAELVWVPYEESIKKDKTVSTVTRMRLAWQVYIIQTTSSDYWLVCIDAMDNKTLRVDNLTVYDNWGHPSDTRPGTMPALINGTSKPGEPGNDPFGTKNIFTASGQTPHSPLAVNNSSYRVIPYPAESPDIAGPAVRNNPWLAAPGNATTLGWHTGLAGAEYDYTRGNNVWAYQDRIAPLNTGSIAKSASSTTSLPDLTFDFVPNFTVDPLQETPVPNKQFNVTNLFYWNNIIHDVMYQYGFDEPAHNFQDDNLGRGGVGNDHVNAEAQDGAGTNNANFSTPNDGGSGRMQMFLWNLNGVNPLRDGDVDNGIIVHEYGHGISIRLTGGGATVCLTGAEQMGEGWSDYYMLMFTTNWATATAADGFNIPRHLGAYALNNVSIFTCPYPAPIPPCTATPNLGIRHFPYSTNMAVNPWVYANVIPSSVHDRGEIWAATLWDMTWKLIEQRGISANIYDATATGGNVVAMRLVTTGLKLQPCSVGFIDGRNAILAADQALYGGANQCLIWEAFARRGMGYSASQGSSGSVIDQTPAYDLPSSCYTEPVIEANGSAITAESCSPPNSGIDPNETVTVDLTLSNLSQVGTTNLVATLQATGGVTNPSGPQNYGVVVFGSPDVTRPFSFTAGNVNCGDTITLTLQLQDGATSLGTVTYKIVSGGLVSALNENFDGVTAPNLPAGWVATNEAGASTPWQTSNAAAVSAPNSIFVDDPSVVSLRSIETPVIAITSAGSTLSFQHNYNTEAGYDGGVLEISIGGAAFVDILAAGGTFISGGYNRTLSTCCTNPLPGRQAWSGNSNGFITTVVNLPVAVVGQSIKFRFRMGTDESIAGTGWRIDNVSVSRRQCCDATCVPPAAGIGAVGSLAFCAGGSVGLSALTEHYFKVLTPQQLTFLASSAVFGPAVTTTPVSGDIVYIPDYEGCSYPPGSLTGKVALIDRGGVPPCNLFTNKVRNAEDAGAIGVIIVNNQAGPPVFMGGNNALGMTIPVIMISQADGTTLKTLIAGGTVNGTSYSPNTFLWSNSATTQNILVTQPGNYSVTVSTSASCSSTSDIATVTNDPVVVCPANIVVGNTPGTCGAVVNFPPAVVTNACNAVCPAPTSIPNYTYLGEYGGHRYFRSNFSRTWNVARATAIGLGLGAKLVSITSAAENNFLNANNNQFAWIGLTDEVVEGDYRWESGEPFTFSDWRAGDPNGGTAENYVATNFYGNPQWVDMPQFTSLPFLVEFDCQPVAYQTSGLPSGSVFPVGVTTNTFTYSTGGNNYSCSFTVTVNDTELPVLTCPANITVQGNGPTVVNYSQPTVTDNCLPPCANPTSIPQYSYLGSYGGHTYFISNFSRYWPAANATAMGLGAHLLTVNSAAERDFISAATTTFAWIGLTDEVSEGNFKWVTGEPLTFTDWRPGEPNNTNGNENHVAMNFYGNRQWVDLNFLNLLPFIIEFECTAGVVQTQGLPSGAAFPVGTTTNVFSYTDAANNVGTCSFTVTVENAPPFTEAAIPGKAEMIKAESTKPMSVMAYPNPSGGEFSLLITSQTDLPITVRILDVTGMVKKVEMLNNKTRILKTGGDLPAGVYVAEVIQGKERQMVKLIKTN